MFLSKVIQLISGEAKIQTQAVELRGSGGRDFAVLLSQRPRAFS